MVKDRIHYRVRSILEKNGYTVFKDPLYLDFANTRIEADLGVEIFLESERKIKRAVIEIKSYTSHSLIQDVRNAVGQVLMYEHALEELNKDLPVYLTMPITIYRLMSQLGSYLPFIEKHCNTMIYNTKTGEILEWKHKPL